MAFKTSLAKRLFNISKISHQTLTTCRISPSAASRIPRNEEKPPIDPGDASIFRRFIHKIPLFQSSVPEVPRFPADKLMEQLRCMDIGRDRIRLDGLMPPASEGKLTVEDARKLMKVAQIEMVKSKIRKIGKSCVSYEEFVEICVGGAWSSDQGLEIAKMLDESGTVLVLGKVVFLRPDQGRVTLVSPDLYNI